MRPGVEAIVEFVEGGGERGRLLEATRSRGVEPSLAIDEEGEAR
jgi:hypothetical protein